MFTLICVRVNGCVNNREAGDLRRYCAHCGVTVIQGDHVFRQVRQAVVRCSQIVMWINLFLFAPAGTTKTIAP